jgi:hypothetical protein
VSVGRGFDTWCATIANRCRQELRLRDQERLDPWRLAGRLGLVVRTILDVPNLETADLHLLTQEDPDSWSAVTIFGGHADVVILNPAHSHRRQAAALMHEIAHVLLAHVPSRVDVGDTEAVLLVSHDASQEAEAERLAKTLS